MVIAKIIISGEAMAKKNNMPKTINVQNIIKAKQAHPKIPEVSLFAEL
jgi:hypothetical protein